MIYYTIDAARGVVAYENICVSTDDIGIKNVTEQYGLEVPFIRPEYLATDTASSQDVILHALDFYKEQKGKNYLRLCLLQPTSPFRSCDHIIGALNLWEDELDMVVFVKKSKSSPYTTLFEENALGLLKKSKEGNFTRRQDVPLVWEYNGALYLMNIEALRNKE